MDSNLTAVVGDDSGDDVEVPAAAADTDDEAVDSDFGTRLFLVFISLCILASSAAAPGCAFVLLPEFF